MDSQKHSEDSFQLYHHTLKSLPGALKWYGNDYHSFAAVLDQTVQRLKASRLKNNFSFTVHLPDEGFKNPPLEEWKNNYCIEKTLEHRAEYHLMKRQGYRFLLKGLVFLWACLSTAYLLDQLNALGDYPKMLGKETFYFLGWVILWKPVEMIVFEPWLEKHHLKLLKKLEQTPITVLYENRI
ncbi:MAG: hypothetical protein JWO58_1707 [Chitinophagaceae bacterium]|nr:hypothetical protein [Chitinophagaceae bacterium]